jgi:pseudaminic acid biosynthesis-associated methylase
VSRQEAFWEGQGGDAYLERNRVAWSERVPFFADLLPKFQPIDLLEVGCNAGWNLLAIRSLKAVPFGRLCGCDVNDKAIAEAHSSNLAVQKCAAIDVLAHYGTREFDLVFTAGLLIHVAPEDLYRVMSGIKQVSRRWVLAVEYEAPWETEIVYRGEKGLLWKRDFGRIYEAMDLKLVEKWEAVGFDRCTAWLLSKEQP